FGLVDWALSSAVEVGCVLSSSWLSREQLPHEFCCGEVVSRRNKGDFVEMIRELSGSCEKLLGKLKTGEDA
ncbi:hypothetical protein Droror1_Dr00020415, partial [Drosera rotundifolia]